MNDKTSTPMTRDDWQSRSEALDIRKGVCTDGAFCAAVSGATFACISPIDGRHVADITAGEEADACDKSTQLKTVWINIG